MITGETIKQYLFSAKSQYKSEGLLILGLFGSFAEQREHAESDIDVLIRVEGDFAKKYPGFKAFARLNEIKTAMEKDLGQSVDFADISGLGELGQKHIVEKTIYV